MGKRGIARRNEKTPLDWALAYHRLGWCVIPIPYGQKKARIHWKRYQQQRPDEKQLVKWFSNGPRNMAVVLGEVSGGLTCRDFDTMDEYTRWAQQYPDLAKMLPTVQTANGMHVYFEGHVQGIKHIANGELRGSGGYCLLPPSLHPAGPEYQWVNPPLNGNLLAVDASLAGFLPDVTERTERTERIDENEGELNEIRVKGSVERAIIETLPSVYGTRHRKIFLFARTIKSMPQFADASPADFRPQVIEWHKRALPHIRTNEFDVTWTDFCLGWEEVRHLIGEEPMTQIFERAKQAETPKVAVTLYPGNPNLQLFITLCRELQKEAGETPFFLDCRTGARYLNVSAMQISRWFRTLEIDKVVKLIQKGGFVEVVKQDGTTRKERRASKFKYLAV